MWVSVGRENEREKEREGGGMKRERLSECG